MCEEISYRWCMSVFMYQSRNVHQQRVYDRELKFFQWCMIYFIGLFIYEGL